MSFLDKLEEKLNSPEFVEKGIFKGIYRLVVYICIDHKVQK